MNTMTGKRHIIMLLLLAAAAVCRGQILDIDHDKKIIYADSIRLAYDTCKDGTVVTAGTAGTSDGIAVREL